MKNIFYYISLVVATCCLFACSPDEEANQMGGSTSGNSVNVELRLGVSSSASVGTRAGGDYSDPYKMDGELMRNWFVVIVDQDRQIVAIKQNDAYGAQEKERAQDNFWERLPVGKYTFYSFANIKPADVGMENMQQGDLLPQDFFENQKYTVKIPTFTYADHWSDFGEDYFKDGIPMSNKQEVTITAQTKSVDLEVIRMVAKVTLQLSNTTTHDITLKGLTLSDITPNVEDNLMLLPGADKEENGEVYVDKPNLAIADNQKKVERYTVRAEAAGQDYVIKGNGGTMNVCFYVNESEATAQNKYIVLQLQTTDASQELVNRRYAMLDWKQICRNDLRIIPVRLDDYAIEWSVEAFTPIGVMPKVKDDGENLTIDFRYYGEFHITPKVKKLSTGKPLSYSEHPYDEGWYFLEWKPIMATPAGDAGTNIFDVNPTWVKESQRLEGEMGNRTGTAIYQLTVNVYKSSAKEWIQLVRKVRFAMTEVSN